MGVYSDPILTPTGRTQTIKSSGLLAHCVYLRVLSARIPGTDYLDYCYELTPEQCRDVAKRMYAELAHEDMSKFTHAQQYWTHHGGLNKAFLLMCHAETGKNLFFC